ncbi:MAG TPA: hypothetical protein VLI93_07435 [Acetobacteraceae bacterium]|nr:hypothetical protein [Acetobacteraceae bacterium]
MDPVDMDPAPVWPAAVELLPGDVVPVFVSVPVAFAAVFDPPVVVPDMPVVVPWVIGAVLPTAGAPFAPGFVADEPVFAPALFVVLVEPVFMAWLPPLWFWPLVAPAMLPLVLPPELPELVPELDWASAGTAPARARPSVSAPSAVIIRPEVIRTLLCPTAGLHDAARSLANARAASSLQVGSPLFDGRSQPGDSLRSFRFPGTTRQQRERTS